MKSNKCEDDALWIIHFFLRNNQDRKSTMKHFENKWVNKSTIQRVLTQYVDSSKVDYSKKSGPQPFVLTDYQLKKINIHYTRNQNTSEPWTTYKFNISKTSVVTAKKKFNIKSRKKVIGPKYVRDQKERAEKSLRRLYKLSVPSGREKFFYYEGWNLLPSRSISGTR